MLTLILILWFLSSIPAIYFFEKVVGDNTLITLLTHLIFGPVSLSATFLFYLFDRPTYYFKIFK